jgi:hypothetical protein
MRAYTWKSRTELQVKGDVQSFRLEAVRFDPDGKQQKTLLSEEKEEPRKKFGLPGLIQAKKAKAAKDWMTDLGQLLHSYLAASKGQLVDYFEHAKLRPEDQTVRIEGQNFILTGDRMTYWIDKEHSRPQKMQIDTAHEGDPIRLLIEFRVLPDTLNYPARATVTVPAKQVQITIENFDHHRQSANGGGGSRTIHRSAIFPEH